MDELTSLGNRSFFHRAAKRRMELYERNALPLACAILDVDDFKFYNDNHGHEGGDARIVGYHAPDQRVKPSEGLGHQGGAKRRPRERGKKNHAARGSIEAGARKPRPKTLLTSRL